MSRYERERLIARKMNNFQSQYYLMSKRMKEFNHAYFVLTDYLDYLSDAFDCFLIADCEHFSSKDDN